MFGWLINQIAYGLFVATWYLFCWFPLVIIKVITTLFGSINFNLLKGIVFGQNQEFSVHKIPTAFWIFAGLSAGALFFLILYRLLKGLFYGKDSQGRPSEGEVKSIILKTISAIFFPILFVAFLFIILIGANITIMAIKSSLNYNHDLNVSLIRGASGDLNLEPEQITTLSKGNVISFEIYQNWSWGQGPKLILLVLLSSLTVAWLLGTTLTSLVANIAQMFYQLILLPVFSVSQISDDGKLFKKYLNGFWAKFWVVIIYQVAFLFFFVWTEYSVNAWDFIKTHDTDYGGVANWILSFVFSLVMILGGGIAIKTISQEFAGYFGGEGFVRSQQEWANRTALGVSATAGLLAAAPAFGRKQYRKVAKLTGYYDSEKAKIKDDYRAGRITNTQKKLRLNELANKKAQLGQTFRQGWEKSRSEGKGFIRSAWAGKEAFKESKDMGIIEGKGYTISKNLSKLADWRAKRAEKKLDKVQKNFKEIAAERDKTNPKDDKFAELGHKLMDTGLKTVDATLAKKDADRKQKRANEKFAKRSKNLYDTVQIGNDVDYREKSSYKSSYDSLIQTKIEKQRQRKKIQDQENQELDKLKANDKGKENNEKTNSE